MRRVVFGGFKKFSYLCTTRGHGGGRVVPMPRDNRVATLEVWTLLRKGAGGAGHVQLIVTPTFLLKCPKETLPVQRETFYLRVQNSTL